MRLFLVGCLLSASVFAEVTSLKDVKELELCLNDILLDIEKEELAFSVKESESEAPK